MILYAGNILSKHGYTPTFIESLAPKLSERYEVKTVSEKKGQLPRLKDMVSSLIENRNKIKLVLIDSYSRKAFWYSYILARLSKRYNIPYIPILRGGGYPDRLKKSPTMCKYIFSNSMMNISPSLYLKKNFEDNGYNVEYIPNFISIEKYFYKERKKISPKLFWVRSFHEIYNPTLAIEILEILKKKYSEAELCMVGPDKDGSLQKVMNISSEKSLDKSVKITGKLSKEDWIRLSESYDIFINTTNFDNHPVSLIEAMALGLPVISTNVGGIPFLIEDNVNGILVERNNAQMFVDNIEKLLNDEFFSQSISKSARKMVEEFDWKKVQIKWNNTIDSVLESAKKYNS